MVGRGNAGRGRGRGGRVTVYYNQLTNLESWAKQYVGARITLTGRATEDRGTLIEVEGTLSFDDRGRLMIDDSDGDRFKFPKVGWEYAKVMVFDPAGNSLQYNGVVELDGDFAANVGTEVLENQRQATEQRNLLMAALNSERQAREGMEARIMARLGGAPVQGPALEDPSAASSGPQDSEFVWYLVHTWSPFMDTAANREMILSMIQRELEISSHSPPHVRGSLDLIRGWVNTAVFCQLDYTHPDSPFTRLGATIIRILREAHLARSGGNMPAFHRLMQSEAEDSFAAAAAKAGSRVEKKKTVKCFTCGQAGHMSNTCPEAPKDKGQGGAPRAPRK